MIVNLKRNFKNSIYNVNINLTALTIAVVQTRWKFYFFPSMRAAVHSWLVGSSVLHSHMKIQIFLPSRSTTLECLLLQD